MSKSKYSPEFRAMVSQKYIDGEGTVDDIAVRWSGWHIIWDVLWVYFYWTVFVIRLPSEG